ncbi:MAG: hypothetical protein FJZ95_11480 [Chloroflexi bacterium]|nr:hypothetical protein [Chloroflexota bacterium]
MNFEPNCRTTAMGVMPHKDPIRALEFALKMDIPFWPQLPRATFSEDMFTQFAVGFPGTNIDLEGRRVTFDTARFMDELAAYSEIMEDSSVLAGGLESSMTFPRFIGMDFRDRPAIRGQLCGPVNFGFRVTDEEKKPLIYNDDVRALLFDFAQKKVNAQYRLLAQKHPNAFVWVDEPGLGWVFNSFSGYNELQAQEDYRSFLAGFEGPRALHLCLNVHLPYLFGLGLDVLSIDAFQFVTMPRGYAEDIARFLKGGGIVSWGLVPTESMTLDPETPETLYRRLLGYWDIIAANSDIPARFIAERALIAPAKCCIKNAVRMDPSKIAEGDDPPACAPAQEEPLVERAFAYLGEISGMLRERFNF